MSNKIFEGYYVKYGISVGQISLIPHSSSGKDNLVTTVAKTATDIQRLDISVLGDNYKWV